MRLTIPPLVGAALALLALRPSLRIRWFERDFEASTRGTLIESRFAELRDRLRGAGVSQAQFIADGVTQPEAYYRAQYALAPITLVPAGESQQYALVDFANGMRLPAIAAQLDATIVYERDGLALLRRRRWGHGP
jgi:hypothetical protein